MQWLMCWCHTWKHKNNFIQRNQRGGRIKMSTSAETPSKEIREEEELKHKMSTSSIFERIEAIVTLELQVIERGHATELLKPRRALRKRRSRRTRVKSPFL